MSPALYPLFLKLDGKKVVLVGGGTVAAAKLSGLLGSGAEVIVSAPHFLPGFERSGVTLQRREFVPSDLDGAWFVIAAATPEVNRQVFAAAQERRIFVNSVDDPDTASAYAGGVFRREGLTVAISTEGQAPALAGLLREGIESLIPDDYATWVETAASVRRDWKTRGVPMPNRRPLLLLALNNIYAEKVTS